MCNHDPTCFEKYTAFNNGISMVDKGIIEVKHDLQYK